MDRSRFLPVAFATVALLLAPSAPARAETLRWARAGDALTLDPHALNAGPTIAFLHQVYEPLLQRDMDAEIIPALATGWALTDDPNVWRFELRRGVTFHGGQEFAADDVVFSIERAKAPTSAMREVLAGVVEARAIDDHTVELVTDGPSPILPANLLNLFIVDAGWAVENGAEAPQDLASGGENFAAANVNGTGAYRLVSRTVGERTVLRANESYWGRGDFPLEVHEIVYTPIRSAATRVAALMSGGVDLIQDVPVQDLDRVAAQDGLKISSAPQNRTIFLGMNQGADDLASDDVRGSNPFADPAVREAMNLAIDREAIRRVVMRGQAEPTGVIIPPFVNGWTEELHAPSEPDPDRARRMISEAGYPDGFGVRLDCPNDRYVNDEAICQALVGMFGRIGVRVTLDAKPKAQHFPLIHNGTTDFYLLGWGVPTFDSEFAFNFLVHTRTDERGSWNATGYSNARVDRMIQGLSSETDLAKRDEAIAAIWRQVRADTLYLPLHDQVLNWGMREDIDFDVQPEDQPHFKFLRYVD